MKGEGVTGKQKRKLAQTVLAISLMGAALSGCTKRSAINTPDDTFYERREPDVDDVSTAYSSRMDAVYENAMKRFLEPEAAEEMEGRDIGDKLTRKILNGYQRSYYVFRTLGPVISIFSIATGVFMMLLARHNKKLKRTGLMVFIIGIPAVVILLVFGIGIFNGILLY